MGWCTYNGDHMSMYGVNASVPKTLVKYLVEYVANVSDKKTADILYDVLDTPVSPELCRLTKTATLLKKRRIISALMSFTISFCIILFASALKK